MAAVAAAVVAVLLTWPIAPRLGSAGRVDSGDGRYSIWNVAWVAHALTTDPLRVYDANIFYPHPKALTFSEANLVAGAIAVPVWVLTRNAYAASNFVILCSFFLTALTTYALGRRLTSSIPGAAVASIGFAFCPYVFAHLPHVQLLMTFGLPLVLLLLHGFVDAPGPRRAAGLGAAIALTGLCSGYYGFFAGLTAALGVFWFGAHHHQRDRRYWLCVALVGVVAVALVLPFVAPYAAIQADGFHRSLDEARLFSVRWRSYLASPMIVHRWILPLLQSWREVLFPGFLALALAALAIQQTFSRRRPAPSAADRSTVGFYVALAGLALWASLGPDFGLYALLYTHVPFFSLLRAPARFGVLVTLAAAVLSGIGFANLLRRFAGSARSLVVAGILLLAFVKHMVGPLALPDAPKPSEAHKRLAALPAAAVAEFPYFVDRADQHRHTEYMLLSTLHWKPLVNGYSDHIPADVRRDMPALAAFPDIEAWSVLRHHRTRYVLIHWPLYSSADRFRLTRETRELAPYLRPIVDSSSVSLYEIIAWPDGTDNDPSIHLPGPPA